MPKETTLKKPVAPKSASLYKVESKAWCVLEKVYISIREVSIFLVLPAEMQSTFPNNNFMIGEEPVLLLRI